MMCDADSAKENQLKGIEENEDSSHRSGLARERADCLALHSRANLLLHQI
jgi:hypothetical protein